MSPSHPSFKARRRAGRPRVLDLDGGLDKACAVLIGEAAAAGCT